MVLSAALALALCGAAASAWRALLACASVVLAVACARASRAQLGMWADSDLVFERIVSAARVPEVREQNFMQWAHADENQGRDGAAQSVLERARREFPGLVLERAPGGGDRASPEAAGNLKIAIDAAREGRRSEAEAHFGRSLLLSPGYGDARYDFALFLALDGRPREALRAYSAWSVAGGNARTPAAARLLSALGASFWDKGERGLARVAVERALPGAAGDASLTASLRAQAAAYAP
jgi:hypothetical protein